MANTNIISDLLNIFDDINLYNTSNNTKEMDLINNEDDYNTFISSVENLKSSSLFNKLCNIFNIKKEDLDNLVNVVNNIKETNKENENKFHRPSETIPTNTGLQIHKLVQEYIDTMVKPYNDGILTTDQLNNAYAGLYEFSCWLYQHK